jgi:uncharacterized protein (TIGR02678 family)
VLRHHLARRLLDDPVVYIDELAEDARAYFINQRGAMAARLCEATGLTAEQRAEGLALVDATGSLTDIALPAEGTDAHVTLLVGDFLARAFQVPEPRAAGAGERVCTRVPVREIVAYLREAKVHFGKYWRKSARVAGVEDELAETAIGRLRSLHLLARHDGEVIPLPALARFAFAPVEVRGEHPPAPLLGQAQLEVR